MAIRLDKKILGVLVLLFCVICLSVATAYTGTGFTHNKPDNYYDSMSTSDILDKYPNTYLTSEEQSVCTRVVDGDTIHLSNGRKIRMVGVNTPEKGVDGCQASKKFVEKLCLNKQVGINIDDKKYYDKYGRTLAVVIVDGKNLNEMLLKEGLAEVMYIPPSEFSPQNWADPSIVAHHTTEKTGTGSDVKSVSSHNKNVVSTGTSSGYVGNLNSGKFHKSSCDQVDKMSEKNKVFFSNRGDAISQGYIACKRCNP